MTEFSPDGLACQGFVSPIACNFRMNDEELFAQQLAYYSARAREYDESARMKCKLKMDEAI